MKFLISITMNKIFSIQRIKIRKQKEEKKIPKKKLLTLNVFFDNSQNFVTPFSLKICSTETIQSLMILISKKIGLPRDYFALWKSSPFVDEKGKITNRQDLFRIDYQPQKTNCNLFQEEIAERKANPKSPKSPKSPNINLNLEIEKKLKVQELALKQQNTCIQKWQEQTLREVGIKNQEQLTVSIYPLRGSHIHLSVNIMIQGECDKEPKLVADLYDR